MANVIHMGTFLIGCVLVLAGIVGFLRRLTGGQTGFTLKWGEREMTFKGPSMFALIIAGVALILAANVMAVRTDRQLRATLRSAAEASLDAARQAEAAEYAPQSLKAAEDAVATLDSELAAQGGKLPVFRNYRDAESLVASARTASEKARGDANAGRESAKQAANTAIAELKVDLSAAKEMLDKAPKGKGTAADSDVMKADLAGVESAIAEAENALNAGKYKDAKAKAEAALESVRAVKSAVESATAAKTSKMK